MLRISLTAGQAPSDIFGPGWGAPEPGQTWAVGEESWLFLPVPSATQPYRLALRVWPHVRAEHLLRQRLILDVNRRRVAEFSVSDRQTVYALLRPEWFSGRREIGIRLLHPDNARPADFPDFAGNDRRKLAIAYEEIALEALSEAEERVAGEIEAALLAPAKTVGGQTLAMPAAEVLARFESAGDDCEFGFVQRAYGLEQLGLLRFAGIALHDLARALNARFAGLGERLEIVVPHDTPGLDLMGSEPRYGLTYHTYLYPDTTDAARLLKTEKQRLPRLAEKYLEDIALGEKIFVVKSRTAPPPVLLASVYLAFRALGPATLMWVREADGASEAGTARWLIPGLIVAYVDRLDVPPLRNVSAASWLDACRAAFGLWTEDKAEFLAQNRNQAPS